MNRILFFAILLLPAFLFSCKRPKTISEIMTTKSNVSCSNEEIDFVYFVSKAKINYKDDHNDLKSNVNVRIKKDSIIWISINAAAGFEALRILITTDSLHVMNRMENSYAIYDFASLSNRLNVDLSYGIIQSILLGNLIMFDNLSDVVVSSDSNYCVFKQKTQSSELVNYIKIASKKVDKVEVSQGTENNLVIKYFNFVPLGIYSFASKNEICLKHKEGSEYQITNIDIDHHKSEFPDKEINFPFNVPNKFIRNK
jgi:hypothetical protein